VLVVHFFTLATSDGTEVGVYEVGFLSSPPHAAKSSTTTVAIINILVL